MKLVMPEQNQYTRMIYDGQRARAHKLQAEKFQKMIHGQADAAQAKPNPADQSTQKPGKVSGAKVINNLKAAGLGALIGKISSRVSKNSALLQAAGVSAEEKTSGRALGVGGGGALDKLGGGTAGGSNSHKIGGVGTLGKGGGSSALQRFGRACQRLPSARRTRWNHRRRIGSGRRSRQRGHLSRDSKSARSDSLLL